MGKQRSRFTPEVYQWATDPFRALPDYIIIGAQKSGTTSLQSHLRQHPTIRAPRRKEIHYFDRHFERPLRWYRRHFPIRKPWRSGEFITGEATPSYLFDPLCAERIASRVPQVRLIVLLRNPVARAISHYFHTQRRGREPLGIAEALAHEPERMARGLECRGPERIRMEGDLWRFSYRARGVYVDQLLRYEEHFPAGQLLVLRAEDLFADPKPVFERIFAFLGIDPGFCPPELRPRHVGSYSAQDVPDSVVSELEEYFRPHNERLYAHLGIDFGW